MHADSVSRSYYAAFHALRAHLLSRGVEPKTHSGAIHLFNTEFVRQGLFPTRCNRLVGGLQRARELADYDAAVQFDDGDADQDLADAREFVELVERHLAEQGWWTRG